MSANDEAARTALTPALSQRERRSLLLVGDGEDEGRGSVCPKNGRIRKRSALTDLVFIRRIEFVGGLGRGALSKIG